VTATVTSPSPARRRSLVRRVLASGLIDRLAAPHGVDRYLELLDPLLVIHETRAQVVGVGHQTPATVTLTLRPNDAWNGFRAGQHVVVGVPIDGVVHRRCFSLAGSPHRADGTLELTVKASPNGRVSRHLVDRAAVGDVLRLSAASGDFVLPPPDARAEHLVLVSGGSGITPVLSMLRTLVDEEHDGPVTFVHYARSEADLCYAGELPRLVEALPRARLLLGFTEQPGAGDLDGAFGARHLAAVTDDPASARVFVCGPPPLTASVVDHFDRLGLGERVELERFGPPPVDPALDAGDGVVVFARTGGAAPGNGTLLATAEAAGLTPPYGCRSGICGTCTTDKSAGIVRDLVTGQESAADAGPVKLCVSVPCGEVVVDL